MLGAWLCASSRDRPLSAPFHYSPPRHDTPRHAITAKTKTKTTTTRKPKQKANFIFLLLSDWKEERKIEGRRLLCRDSPRPRPNGPRLKCVFRYLFLNGGGCDHPLIHSTLPYYLTVPHAPCQYKRNSFINVIILKILQSLKGYRVFIYRVE